MDAQSIQWVQDNLSLVWEFSHIKTGEDKTVPVFHVRFVTTFHTIYPSFQPKGVLVTYVFAFDWEFHFLLWSLNHINLEAAFYTALRV